MNEFKICVVGCGGMSKTWIKYAVERAGCTIAALVDVFPENANKRKEEFGLDCPVYTDLARAIKEQGINLVFDVSIPEAHYSVAKTAMENGCDCFGEKPMSDSIENAREMVKIAKATGRTYAVMQNRRFSKAIRAYKELLEPEVIGDLGVLKADFFIGAHFDGFRAIMDSPLVLDMAIHPFDQGRFLAGGKPVSAYCYEYNPGWSWYKGAACAVCIFEFDNGVVFTYNGSWCTDGFPTQWECDWRAVGSKGTALWTTNEGDGDIKAQVVKEDDEFIRDGEIVLPKYNYSGNERHTGCLDNMFEGLINKTPIETVCHDNILSMEMVFAAIESSKTGKKVEIR